MSNLTDEQISLRDTSHTYHMDNHRNRNAETWTVYEGGGTYGRRNILRDGCTTEEAEAYVRTLRLIDPDAS